MVGGKRSSETPLAIRSACRLSTAIDPEPTTNENCQTGKSYRIDDGKHFQLKDYDPADTGHWHSVEQAKEQLQKDVARMEELQAKLYAQDRWALLLIFQAMDAAGKDGTIKHVMSGVNPEGCQVTSFKTPSDTELQHDFLWRTTEHLPERGTHRDFQPLLL
jgi:polyphosphate kinase 2 (PPK2 family)